jgi:hypothetical protein
LTPNALSEHHVHWFTIVSAGSNSDQHSFMRPWASIKRLPA